jgi:hypothetical protein
MSDADAGSETAKRTIDVGGLVKGALIGVVVTAGFLLVVGVLVFRQTVPRLSQSEFDAAVKRGRQNGPANYNCDIVIFGNRPGMVQVEVRGGQVQKMMRDGMVPKARRTWDAWTVEGMFDTIERELEIVRHPEQTVGGSSPPVLYAKFDDQSGYPEIFRRSVPGAQQDMAWEVTRFDIVK